VRRVLAPCVCRRAAGEIMDEMFGTTHANEQYDDDDDNDDAPPAPPVPQSAAPTPEPVTSSAAAVRADQQQSMLEEPLALCCPITHLLMRDPAFVPESGTTYERSAILSFWCSCDGPRRDPLNNVEISTDVLYTNWDKRREVAAWLAENPTYLPQGWRSRDDVPSANAHLESEDDEILANGGAGRGAPALQGLLRRRNHGRRAGRGEQDRHWWGPQRARQLIALLVIFVALAIGLDAHTLLLEDDDALGGFGGVGHGQRGSSEDVPLEGATRAGADNTLGGRRSAGDASGHDARLLARRARHQCHVADPALFDGSSSAMSALLGAFGMPHGPPPGSRLAVGILRRKREGMSRSARGGELDGLVIDLPRASLLSAFSGQLAMGTLFTGFTWVWTAQAWWGGAPLPFLCFSAPFWFAGASMLKSGLLPLFEHTRLLVLPQGLHLETTRSLFPSGWGALTHEDASNAAGAAADRLEMASTYKRCIALSWANVDGSPPGQERPIPLNALQPVLRSGVTVSLTMVVNGVELGELSVRDGHRMHVWGSQLSMAELRYVRELILSWSRAAGRGVGHR
jgi:hypothetical protein